MTPKPGLTLGMTKAGAASASPLAGLTEPQQAPLATLNAGAAATLNAGAAATLSAGAAATLNAGAAATLSAGAAQAGIGAVRVYQWTVRPLIGAHCRFWPSCSEYAVEALRTHGAAKGTVLAAKRILRCNPWNEGGVDPVPRRDGDRVDRNMGH